ncbi:YegS/Rv2252/BmrU family lipid kinase [Streptomyces sp. DSM 44917]|uniref:YegS/Rv2252/BmrU family lipid kinase n=1 Tax=Streptomyces boetiae TaxID=3075541 RepID=A0ABU2LG38_9ACTN|nr:YegS/Rv2252/BmrU family lipid kinase [Streptomyces sp. DSM 44917]MDT0310551.1 YegS/Rv2252/BmrU family lipid kinase [Streptomyces sp. DSM 44917]
MRQFTALVNPTAGRARAAAAFLPVARLLREAGAGVETLHSTGPDHARALARAAAGAGRVVLGVGGDGTVGCVLGALAGTGAPAGIVPAGRGNDFARALALPAAPEALARVLAEAPPQPVDAIEVTSAAHERLTVMGSVYAGVDALANRHANASRLRGPAAYYAGGLRAVLSWRPAHYRLTVDGTPRTHTGYTVVAANSGFYGSGRRIAPSARLDDGWLEVVLIRHAPRRLFFRLMSELKDGTHTTRPEVETLRAREIRIEADRPLPYGADGEVTAALPVTARILPGALSLLAPPLPAP